MDARVKPFEEKMQKAYDFLLNDYQTIRAGRANPHVLDKLKVDYYGTPTPIQQVGNITVPEARMIQIAPWEKSLIREIEKAIMVAPMFVPVVKQVPNWLARHSVAIGRWLFGNKTKFLLTSEFDPDVQYKESLGSSKARFEHNMKILSDI